MNEFNLFFSRTAIPVVKSAYEESALVPLPSSYDFWVLDVIKVLKKSTMVKRSL